MRAYRWWIISTILAVSGIAGCTREQSRLIPLEILFGNPTKTQIRLAPDGSGLTYIAPSDGVLNIWLKEKDGERDQVLTLDDEQGIRYHMWLYDNRQVLYIQDRNGDENWQVYLVEVQSGAERQMTGLDDSSGHPVRAELLMLSPAHPNDIVIGLNKRDERVHDAYLLNTESGALTLLERGEVQSHGWLIDNDLAVRGWLRADPEGGSTLLLRNESSGPFVEVIHWDQEDELASGDLGFSGDNRMLYLKDSRGRNSAALYAYDTVTGAKTLLAEDPMYDVGGLLYHPKTMAAQAAYFVEDRREWVVLDEAIRADIERIQQNERGDFIITQRTLDDKLWIVYYAADNGPGVYYSYDRPSNTFTKLFYTQPELVNQPLVTMKPVTFAARDGMELHGYLSLPLEAEQPAPLVLDVHGGPWSRDYWGFNPEAQWLANRGYACLQVNFRGSTGYGKAYLNAGNLEWGGKMQDDLSDAVEWAVNQGIADPDRIAIFGGSYGGYAALAGATFTHDLYACAVSMVGPSSLVTMLSSIPPYWSSFQKVFDIRTGRLPRYESGEMAGLPKAEEDWTDQDRRDIEFLMSRSPLYHVDQIRIPMLIAQGGNDPRVKQAESDQVVEALKARGIEVEYVVYPDEGHGFAKPENRIDFYHRADAFLAKILGGRCEK